MKRVRLLVLVGLWPVSLHAALPGQALLHCQSALHPGQHASVQLDEAAGVVQIDGTPHPAEFVSSHVRVRLADGQWTLGRNSGRYLRLAADRSVRDQGHCQAAGSLHTAR